MALKGGRWFLGEIYGYREAGNHFGVPLSNYLGWWLVSAIMVFMLQRLAVSGFKNSSQPAGVCSFPGSSLLPALLYLAVIIFNLAIAVYIEELTIATTGIFIVILPLVMTLLLVARRLNRYSRNELAEHLRDFPWSTAGSRNNR